MNERQASACFAALGNPIRIRMFRLLTRAGAEGLHVGELQQRVGGPPSTLAHHMNSLVSSGLMVQERDGRNVICRADFETMNGLGDYLRAEWGIGFTADMPPAETLSE